MESAWKMRLSATRQVTRPFEIYHGVVNTAWPDVMEANKTEAKDSRRSKERREQIFQRRNRDGMY